MHEAFAKREAELFTATAELEARYLEVAKTDPATALKLLTEANQQLLAETLALVENLTNELFTQRTADIEKANFFANRKTKD